MGPTEATRPAVKQTGSPDGGRASVRPPREPARYGCSYEDVRWQKPVRRIARRDARGTARRIDDAALAQGLSERRADAHGGGLEAKTVRESCVASKPGGAYGEAAGGNPGRLRHGGRRPDRRSCSSARCGRVTVSVARVNAAAFVATRASEPADRRSWNRRVGARAATQGRQRLAMCGVKAAPADEARVVRHFEAPRGAGPRRSWDEGFAVDAKATPRSSGSRTGQSKLTRANSWVILPDSPNRANGEGRETKEDAHAVSEMRSTRRVRTHKRRVSCCDTVHAFGPKPIDGARRRAQRGQAELRRGRLG